MKNEKENKKIAAVLSVAFFSGANSWINPVMQLLENTHSDISPTAVRLISTLPALITMLTVIVVGLLAGKKLKYKTLITIGLSAIAVGGSAPFFVYGSFPLLMAARVLLGAGVGCIGLRNALVIKSFEEPTRTKVLGMVTLTINIGAILAQQLTGILGKIDIRLSFVVYTAAFVALVLVSLWLGEPAPDKYENEPEKSTEQHKRLLSPRVWFYMAVILVVMMLLYPVQVGISSFMAANNFGDSAAAGTALSVYTLGGALAGFIYAGMQEKIKKYIWMAIFAPIAAGLLLILNASNIVMIIVGMFLCGASSATTVITMAKYAGVAAYPYAVAFSTSMITACGQLGNYVSTYYMELCLRILPKDSVFVSSLSIGAFIALTASVVCLFKDMRPRELIR